MTGPEHYREAERLIDGWQDGISNPSIASEEMLAGAAFSANMLALAQVHATLALAAANAEPWARHPTRRTQEETRGDVEKWAREKAWAEAIS